ncbi:MAG: hypothetical protein ACT4QF_02415 [Sporichthyaceae bacterium]
MASKLRRTAAPLGAALLTAALAAPASAAPASPPSPPSWSPPSWSPPSGSPPSGSPRLYSAGDQISGPEGADRGNRGREGAFVDGTGAASAGVARIALRSSGANIGFGIAQTRARYAGSQGNAESAGVDLGLFDTLGKAPLACGTAPGAFIPEDARPQRVVVSSGNGADAKQTASFGAGTPVEIFRQSGSAAPRASADADVGGVRLEVPGLFTAVGGTASSGAALVPGKQRTATASSTLGRVVLAGGLVELEGLQWRAIERTGAEKVSEGSFALGAVVVGGQRIETPDDASLAQAVEAVRATLEPVGLALHWPQVVATETGRSVTPLRISAMATPTMRTLIAPALEGVQPIRSQLLELVSPLQASPDCGFAKAVGFGYLIADLALIVMGDGGGIDLDLGGARVGTDATAFANPLESGFGRILPPGLPAAPGQAPAGPALPGTGAVPPAAPVPASPGTTDVLAAPAAAPATVQQIPVAAVCRSTHDAADGCENSGGVLAAWLALAFVLLLAAADFLRRRTT